MVFFNSEADLFEQQSVDLAGQDVSLRELALMYLVLLWGEIGGRWSVAGEIGERSGTEINFF